LYSAKLEFGSSLTEQDLEPRQLVYIPSEEYDLI